MLVIGNDELGDSLKVEMSCPNCGDLHKISYGEEVLSDGSKRPSKMLAFVDCPNGGSYLVGVAGKALK